MHATKKIGYFYTAEYRFPEVNAVTACEKNFYRFQDTLQYVFPSHLLYLCYILLRITSGVRSDVKVTRPRVGRPKKNGFILYKEKYFSLLHNLQTGYGACLAPYSISNEDLSLGVKRRVVIPFTHLHLSCRSYESTYTYSFKSWTGM
jgi:hypothetical protein